MTKMNALDRYEWIMDHIRHKAHRPELGAVDILDADFVDAYAEATGMKLHRMLWGAHKCPQLSTDLRKMTLWQLQRDRVGLSGGAWQPGFPKWVWSYRLRGDRI